MYEQEKINPYNDYDQKSKQVEQMFDSIAHSYDFLNHFLSMGLDKKWMKKAILKLKEYAPQNILDVATGTGDFAIMCAKNLSMHRIVGVDISTGMLECGKRKIDIQGLTDVITFQKDDCMNLSFDNDSFDAITVTYGIRNFENLEKGLSEMLRVLKPGGHLVILELCTPDKFPMKQIFKMYSHGIFPFIGNFVSKDKNAYKYLPKTMDVFPQGEIMHKILEKVGYKNVKFNRLTFGVTTLYTASK